MKLHILSIGKTKNSFATKGEQEYMKRLSKAFDLILEDVVVKGTSSLPAPEVKKKESLAVLEKVKSDDFVVVLDERGKTLGSQEFAAFLADQQNRSTRRMLFCIGGAHGWSEEVPKRADLLLSLSSMTFPHEIARLVLIEQVYRAESILRGAPYHK